MREYLPHHVPSNDYFDIGCKIDEHGLDAVIDTATGCPAEVWSSSVKLVPSEALQLITRLRRRRTENKRAAPRKIPKLHIFNKLRDKSPTAQ